APVPREDELTGVARRAHTTRGIRARRRTVGSRERDRLPRQRLLVLHDRRGRRGQQPAPLTRPTVCAISPAIANEIAQTGWLPTRFDVLGSIDVRGALAAAVGHDRDSGDVAGERRDREQA